MSGFTSGFQVGFGAVMAGKRARLQEEEAAQRRRMTDMQLRRLEQDEADRQELRDAAAGKTSTGTTAGPTAGAALAAAATRAQAHSPAPAIEPITPSGEEGAPPTVDAPPALPIKQPATSPGAAMARAAAPVAASQPGQPAAEPVATATPVRLPGRDLAEAAMPAATPVAPPAATDPAAPIAAPAATPPAAAPGEPPEDTAITQGRRIAKVLRKQGRIKEAGEVEDQMRRYIDEGTDKALDVLIAGGDGPAAIAAYNAQGRDKFGKDDKVEVIRRYQVTRPGYAPIDTAEIEITKDGQKTRIQDVFAARYKLHEKSLEMARQGYQAGRDEKADARADRQLDINERWRTDQAEHQRNVLAETVRAHNMTYNAQMARVAAAGAGPDTAVLGLTPADRQKAHDGIDKALADEFPIKDALSPDDAALARQKQQALRGIAQMGFDNAYAAGQSITQQEAIAAAKLSMDPKNLLKSGNWMVVKVNGKQVPIAQMRAPETAQDPAATAGPATPGAAMATAARRPVAPPAPAPAAAPTPTVDPASPAGRSQARQAAARAQAAERQAAAEAASAQLAAQLDADLKSMSPLEVVRKYDAQRRSLPPAALQRLRQAEQSIR